MAEIPNAAEEPPLFDPRLAPTSSLLFYLFAERVAPPAFLGTRAPVAAVRVNTARLACALFAVAFWRLREAGVVSLELVAERRLLKTIAHLRIARTTAEEDGERRDGIEGGILDILTPGSRGKMTPAWETMPRWAKELAARTEQAFATFANDPRFAEAAARAGKPFAPGATGRTPPETVSAVVERWYGSSISGPERLPIQWTRREGIAKGYLAEVDAQRNPLVAVFVGKTTHVPERERIAARAGEFEELFGRWQDMRRIESALASQLDREIIAGIEARRHVSSSTS